MVLCWVLKRSVRRDSFQYQISLAGSMLCVDVCLVQNSTSGMSRLLSNAVGRNSFSNCDFYRYFISQSVARLIAR